MLYIAVVEVLLFYAVKIAKNEWKNVGYFAASAALFERKRKGSKIPVKCVYLLFKPKKWVQKM